MALAGADPSAGPWAYQIASAVSATDSALTMGHGPVESTYSLPGREVHNRRMTVTAHASTPAPPLTAASSVCAVLSDGRPVTLRPIGRDDIELERRFISELSPESRRFRFLETMTEPSEDLLRQLTTLDPLCAAATGAIDPATRQLVGVARYSVNPDRTAEFAVVVSDEWQHCGLGMLLCRTLIDIARRGNVLQLYSIDFDANRWVRRLAGQLGFSHHVDPDDRTQVIYTLDLRA
jgi:GNAT superfamily N-acetyltransferase